MKLYDVARAGEIQFTAEHAHAAHGQQTGTLAGLPFIVAAFVEQFPLDRAQVVRPLLLDVDERPLPAAEGEVL